MNGNKSDKSSKRGWERLKPLSIAQKYYGVHEFETINAHICPQCPCWRTFSSIPENTGQKMEKSKSIACVNDGKVIIQVTKKASFAVLRKRHPQMHFIIFRQLSSLCVNLKQFLLQMGPVLGCIRTIPMSIYVKYFHFHLNAIAIVQ